MQIVPSSTIKEITMTSKQSVKNIYSSANKDKAKAIFLHHFMMTDMITYYDNHQYGWLMIMNS